MQIEQIGHDVQVARDGLTALQKVEQFGASVALLDLGMPRTDRVEFARRIRARGGDKIVIVAVA